MTRKHFNTIGVLVAANIQTAQADKAQAEEILTDWVEYLKTTNPRFRPEDFASYVRSLCKARGYNIFEL